jgi:sulfate/thiosulfate transport system permease protein
MSRARPLGFKRQAATRRLEQGESMLLTTRKNNVIPGFGLTLGITLTYLSLLVLVPLAALMVKASGVGLGGFFNILMEPRVLAAFRLSFGASFIAALINAVFGLLLAWVLVRYSFPGKKIVDAFVDFPFALPTAVAGIALTAMYSRNGWIGGFFDDYGIRIAFTPMGVIIALTFIGLPFVVRTVQPVLQDLEKDVEEAAASLGASRLQTFKRVIFPSLVPSLLTGFALALARAVGEYGSVVFISGNMPMRTEILPLLIVTRLEQYDYLGATALATLMLLASFILLLVINVLQSWSQQKHVKR